MPTRRSRSRRTEAARKRRVGGRGSSARRVGSARAAPRSRSAEIARLLSLVDRAWSGPAWHGPAVLDALRGLGPDEAEARPIDGAHSIGELLLHMARWKRAVTERLGGRPDVPSTAENFPSFAAPDLPRALAALRREHRRLRAAIARLDPGELEAPPAGGRAARYLQAHGIVHHDLWHAGQIVLLRRARETSLR